jgi:hypothetical protein
MTAVMRSVRTQAGPKVLRIAEVQGGRILSERVLERKASFTVDDLTLFEARAGRYHLSFTAEMTGRLALDSGICDLAGLRATAARQANGSWQIALTDDARGKITIGATTYLFQFVVPPIAPPRPQLPLSVKDGLTSRIDWNLTIIAAFSFVLHFGVIGGMYSDWLDPVVGKSLELHGLVDIGHQIPFTPPIERATTYAAPTTSPQTPAPADTAHATHATSRTTKTSREASPSDAVALAAEADAMRLDVIAGFGGRTAVDNVLKASELPTADLKSAAESSGGVRPSNDLELARSGGVVHPGGSKDLSNIAVTHGGDHGTAGPGPTNVGPSYNVEMGAPIASAHVNGAERVVASLKPKFRACYNKGLLIDSSMAGSVTIVAKIGPNGEVTSADPSGGAGLSPEVQSCLAKVVRNARFEAVAGTGATLQIPVKFVQQR